LTETAKTPAAKNVAYIVYDSAIMTRDCEHDLCTIYNYGAFFLKYFTSLIGSTNTVIYHRCYFVSVHARLQQRRPLPTKNRAATWRPCIFCRRTSCMESPTDRTETHAVVDSNIQAPSQVFSFFAPRTDCVMHLRADCRRRTIQILLLLLLSLSRITAKIISQCH